MKINKNIKNWFINLFWYSNGAYSIIKDKIYFWEKNLLTGFSRCDYDKKK